MTPEDLERLVSARLRELPPPHAPATLARRVRTAAGTKRQPARPWSIWPRVWQAAFALGGVVMAMSAVVAWLMVATSAGHAPSWEVAARALVRLIDAPEAIRDRVLWAMSSFVTLLTSPVVMAIVALVGSAALAFAILGTWLGRVARFPVPSFKGVSR